MHSQKIALALTPLFLLARADIQLDNDDVPTACATICKPVVDLTRACEVDLRGDSNDRTEDRLEAQCVCTNDSFNVSRITALCADCMRQNVNNNDNDDDDDDDDNDIDDGDLEDINDIMYTCGFASSSYASGSSTLAASITVNATAPTASSQLTTTIVPGNTASDRQVTTVTGSGTTLTSTGSATAEATGTDESSSTNSDDSGSSATATDDSASGTASASASATDNVANVVGPAGLAGAAVVGAFMMLA
ncbi:hypothetical protein B0T10DRAFT_608061 [Thelonectria olida]|uniref:Protein CAP22 n=1 Tax=Thelonectria olida TaxID=1576542 RepID=A0A9P8W004_9HYPO|nr:hypothetical protein B0T10DRAFT_608061 [Thelonectria olida]